MTIAGPELPAIGVDAADTDGGSVDLFGNMVDDAIAEYKFDATGTLYESHSPRTELPRLAPPKS